MQAVVDVGVVLLVWIVGIVCIPIMKKIQPDGYIAYAIYDLTVCVVVTTCAILYLYQQ